MHDLRSNNLALVADGRRWSFGQILVIAFGSLLALLAAVAALSTWHLRGMQQSAHETSADEWPHLMDLQSLSTHALSHGAAMARLLTASRSERELVYPALDAESKGIDQRIANMRQRRSDPETAQTVTLIEAARADYRAAFVSIGEAIEAEDLQHARRLFAERGQPALDRLIELSAKLSSRQQRRVAEAQTSMANRVSSAEWQLRVLALAALFGATLLSWRIHRRLAGPLEELATAAGRIADGHFSTRVAFASTREVHRVSEAMNAMAEAIGERDAAIQRIAYNDPLTGLDNGAGLDRRVRKSGQALDAVLALDIARLSAVNDVLGHAAGDTVVKTVAQRLATFALVRVPVQPALCARLGSGVLVLGLPQGALRAPYSIRDLELILTEAIATPIENLDLTVDIQFHAGWSSIDRADGITPTTERLVREAEEALADAKRTRTQFKRFALSDPALRRRQLGLLSSLRSAARNGELQIWLQPKWRLNGPLAKTCAAYEALVRWQHPEWGMVPPGAFIPFAERAGMIGIVTRAMLEKALSLLAESEGLDAGDRLSVNVSTSDLLEPDFVDWLREQSITYGAPLHRLTLEITESRLMDEAERALPVMHELRDAGVHWSIDDFGTGYSSLAYLQELPVSELKIDRSFVDRADESEQRRVLLRTIIELGHALNLEVTAEGAERREEVDLLRTFGCDLVQGWAIARPMPAAEAIAWARRSA